MIGSSLHPSGQLHWEKKSKAVSLDFICCGMQLSFSILVSQLVYQMKLFMCWCSKIAAFPTKFRRKKCGAIFCFFSHSFSTQMTCSQARWLNTSRLDYRPLALTTHGILEPRMISRETIYPIDCDNRNGADWVSEAEKWMCKRETLFADCTSLYSSICSMLPG